MAKFPETRGSLRGLPRMGIRLWGIFPAEMGMGDKIFPRQARGSLLRPRYFLKFVNLLNYP